MNRCDHHVSPIAPRRLRAAMPALDRQRPGRLVVRVVAPARHHPSATAVLDNVTQFAQLTSCRARSATPRRCPRCARQLLLALDQAIDALLERSDADVSLCTWTFCCWPIRKARSVAWSSTAGFHQRSKWKTWFAAVRLSPVPPAFSDSTNSARPVGAPGSARPSRRARLAACRRAGTAPRGRGAPAGRAEQVRPNSRELREARAPCRPRRATSSSISSTRASLPERPARRERSCSRWAGWLHTCLSFISAASTMPAALDPVRRRCLLEHLVDDRLVERGLLARQRGSTTFISILSGRSRR